MADDENLPDVDWSQLEDIDQPDLPPGFRQTILTEDMLIKRLLWNMSPCNLAQDVGAKIGLKPASEDVEEKEHQESHQRLAMVIPLNGLVEAMSTYAAKIVMGNIVVGQDQDIPEEEFAEMVDRIEPAIHMASLGIIAELVDVGLLHLPHGFVQTLGMPEQ